MSLHKSKGLTADVVCVVGLIEGLVPFVPSGPEAKQALDLAEQRRLFYVAATRTRRCLILSSADAMPTQLARRMNIPAPAGATYRTRASRFLDEIVPPVDAPFSGDVFAARFGAPQ